MKKYYSLIKKNKIHKYPLGYSKFYPLSRSLRSKRYRIAYAASDFHQTETKIVGVFYKPNAIILKDKLADG